MAFVDWLPLEAYKKLENRVAALRPLLEPVKRLTGGRAPFPWGVIAHVTYRCNFDCSMCCQHIPEYAEGLPGFPIPGEQTRELPTERWKGILDDIAASFPIRPFFHFGGGEPFIYPGILELIAHAKGRGFNVSMITNAWFLEAHARTLVDLGLNRLHVSVDGPEPIHDEVRRAKGSYRRAIDGIRAVVAARRAAGRTTPHVTINCTITRENHRRLEEMIAVRDEAGCDALTYQHLVFLDNERHLADGIDVPVVFETLSRLERAGHEITVYPYVPKRDWPAFYHGRAIDLRRGCGWNWAGLRLHPNGDVTPCRSETLANLADGRTSVGDVWNGPAYREFRKGILAVGNYEECGRCTHRLF